MTNLIIDGNNHFYKSVMVYKGLGSIKLNNLKEQRDEMHNQLIISRDIYKKLNHINYLESYARSKKFFKKDNEEIFVISYK